MAKRVCCGNATRFDRQKDAGRPLTQRAAEKRFAPSITPDLRSPRIPHMERGCGCLARVSDFLSSYSTMTYDAQSGGGGNCTRVTSSATRPDTAHDCRTRSLCVPCRCGSSGRLFNPVGSQSESRQIIICITSKATDRQQQAQTFMKKRLRRIRRFVAGPALRNFIQSSSQFRRPSPLHGYSDTLYLPLLIPEGSSTCPGIASPVHRTALR